MGAEAAVAKQQCKGKRASKKDRGLKPKMTKEERRKKYTDIARKRRDKQNGIRRRKNLVCYNCRQPGHNASECPNNGNGFLNNNNNNNNNTNDAVCTTILCYKCGSTEHALHNCPKRHRGDRNDLPFATCFVCNQKGHLASACSQNKTGIYVNGGSCRRCGSTQHLATDCPAKKKNQNKDDNDDNKNNVDKDLLADVLQVDENPSSKISKTKQDTKDKEKQKKSSAGEAKKKKKRVVNF